MTIRTTICLATSDDPSNDELLDAIRRPIEHARLVARRRAELSPMIRQLLADELTEERIEDLLRRPSLREDLTPEDIVRICEVPAHPRPVSADTRRLLEAAE